LRHNAGVFPIRIITFCGLWLLIGAAQAQSPTFVASATAVVNAGSVTVGQPAGLAQDDVLIAQVTVKGAVSVTPPGALGDWTLVDSTSTSGSAMTQAVFWRRVGVIGSEPASYTFSFSSNARASGAVSAYRNVDTLGSPLNVSGVTSANGAASITLPTLTTTQANTMLVALLGSSRAANGHSVPTGMTAERYEVDTSAGPNGVNASLDDQVQAAAGSTGAKTATMSNATDYVAHLLALRAKPTLVHYSISVSGTTVATCDYVDVVINGHDATHTLTAPPANRSLTLTTSPASGVWQAGLVTGTGAWTPSGSTATYLWPGGETSFTVRLRQYAAATLNINLTDGAGLREDPSEDPNVAFIGSSFRVSNGLGAAANIGTQIAGKPSNAGFGQQALFLQAVTGAGAGTCGTLLPANTDVPVEVGAVCNNPASCSQSITLTSGALASNTATFVPNGGFSATMNFRFTTANSEAAFALNYADAGQITLQFRKAITGSAPAQYVQGSSNAFVARPFGIAFRGATAAAAVSHGTNATAALLAAAGDNFTMTLGAYAWANGQDADNDGIPDATANITGNGLTPNFAWSTTVDIDPLGNLAGQPGAITRAGGAATVVAGEWSGGAATIANWRYSEVGNVFLRATSTDYLADTAADVSGRSGFDGTGNAGGYVGRFRPKSFVVSSVGLTTRADVACAPASAFTYMDEGMKLAFKLTAQNTQGTKTANYTGSYAKHDPTSGGSNNPVSAFGIGARSGTTNLTGRARAFYAVTPPPAWSSGELDLTGANALVASIARNSPDNPDGPYPALQLGLAASDGETAMNTFDLDVNDDAANDHKSLGVSTEVRFGRLRLDNAFGNEAHRVAVPMRVEYWGSAGGFITNTDDNCTSIPRSAIALAFDAPSVSQLAACETAVDADPVAFKAGVAALGLSAPGVNNRGAVVLTVNLGSAGGSYCNPGSYVAAGSAAMPYLLGRWNAADDDGNANTAYDDKPSARAAFGVYGSQPGNFIYFRERY
jgi:MSHA biogenesis protein MshQ